jgi:hypothetical protein
MRAVRQSATRQGGRIRLLRDGASLDEVVIAEVAPDGGTFASFQRTEYSRPGHAPYTGPRQYVMVNSMRSDSSFHRNGGRDRLSAAIKRPFGSEY